jgi:uncharacterized membrane protein YgdD (TMEM256/DUF423 family)
MISTFTVMMLAGLIWQTVCEETRIRDWRFYIGQLLFAGGLLGLVISALKLVLEFLN